MTSKLMHADQTRHIVYKIQCTVNDNGPGQFLPCSLCVLFLFSPITSFARQPESTAVASRPRRVIVVGRCRHVSLRRSRQPTRFASKLVSTVGSRRAQASVPPLRSYMHRHCKRRADGPDGCPPPPIDSALRQSDSGRGVKQIAKIS